MKTFFGLWLVGAVLTIAANVAIIWALAIVGVSGVKAATGQCNVKLSVEEYVKGDLFCPANK